MDLSTFEQLLTPPGQALLERTGELLGSGSDELAVGGRLRDEGSDGDLVAAAMSQVRLRAQAAEKFGPDAARMYFTADGLEQATHGTVAGLRAGRVASVGARGGVLDLCCGVGGDLVAFARAGMQVAGVDGDPVTAAIGAANLRALDLDGSVETGDAAAYPTEGHPFVFIDPARRGSAGRVFDPDRYSPPWSVVERLVRWGAIAKLAPGIPHALIPPGVEAEWVSVDGKLREATLWPSRLATAARRATVVRRGSDASTLEAADVGDDRDRRAWAPVSRFVYEPDDAVVRAHLVAEFAASVDGWLLDPHLAYVSADTEQTTPLGAAYRVVDVLPFREKALRAALRARDVGPIDIKKRGVAVTPERLRARLRLRGSAPATVILTRTPRGSQAILVEPLGRAPSTAGSQER